MIKLLLSILTLFLSFGQTVKATVHSDYSEKDSKEQSRHSIGFLWGYGDQTGVGVTYTYSVHFMQFQHYYDLIEWKGWHIEKVFQPQFNLTSYKPVDFSPDIERGYEFGINSGFLARRHLGSYVNFYLLMSSGPHYVSATPSRQAPGFIFSDHLSVGVNIKAFEKMLIDIRPGFRHISNLGFKRPNGGVNTFLINAGLMYLL